MLKERKDEQGVQIPLFKFPSAGPKQELGKGRFSTLLFTWLSCGRCSWVPAGEMPPGIRDLLFPSRCGAESALPEPGVPAEGRGKGKGKGRGKGKVSLRAGAAPSVPVGEVNEGSGKPSRAALSWSSSRGTSPIHPKQEMQ